MVTGTDYPPNWVILPNASLTINLVRDWAPKPLIEICGNREGFLAIGNILLWISNAPIENESLSITGLSFVRARSALSFTIDQYCCNDKKQSKIIRVDKNVQYEWLIYDELLQQHALGIISIAFSPHGCADHYHVTVDDDSECEFIFIRNDVR
ncbi:MAG: hypothetical protein JSW47_05450 [Phycisphaerales bacterium]|nr:MAG: hypothetical protein JSW47_05450 [Phycisphaerales bacterium]